MTRTHALVARSVIGLSARLSLIVAMPLATALLATALAAPARADDDRPAPSVRVMLRGATTGLGLDVGGSHTTDGPVRTDILNIAVMNTGTTDAEAELALTLPIDAVVGRLSLDVAGRWMEGEILAAPTATRIYNDIVHPELRARRDPALLVQTAPGQWSLNVFPVPPGGKRDIAISYHRLVAAKPGALRVESLPPSADGAGRMFAAVPRFERPVAGPLPERVVVAIDTSLSMRKAGLAAALEVARKIIAARSDVRVVFGDLRASACSGDIEGCLAGLTIGGASDLGALVDTAREQAGSGPAAIVLLTDARATSGLDADGVRAAIVRAVGQAQIAVHVVPIGDADKRVATSFATAGRGSAEGDVLAALAAPRRPRIDVTGPADADVVLVGDDVIVLGRASMAKSRIEVARLDDVGLVKASFDVPAGAAPAFGIARLYGSLEIAHAPAGDVSRLAREWGVAGNGVALLALETDNDYGSRGIARFKAAERALELGLPAIEITLDERKKDRDLMIDGDNDGIPDALDGCPANPETVNGWQDGDGCPDFPRVIIMRSEIRIIEKVYFESGSARVGKLAMPLLSEMAEVLKSYPNIRLVGIEGHTDNREGGRARLSRARANAVRDALVKLGVAPERLFAIGLSEKYPIDANNSVDGRAHNRRVEFQLIAMDDNDINEPHGEYRDELLKRGLSESWPLDAALANNAAENGDGAGAQASLERALSGAPTLAARFGVFGPKLAELAPERFAPIAHEAALAGIMPSAGLEPHFWRALAHWPVGDRASADEAALAKLADGFLEQQADPDVRWTIDRWRLEVAADLMARAGDVDAAARRRSEVVERGH